MSPFLTGPVFLPVQNKPSRQKNTWWFGLCQSTPAYPDSLEDFLGHLSLMRFMSFCEVPWQLCPAAAALSIHCFAKAAPVPGTGHLPGHKTSWAPWPGRTGLWGAGVQPCCPVSGAGADGSGELTWGVGLWAAEGSPERLCTDRNTWEHPQSPGSTTLLWDCLRVKYSWRKTCLQKLTSEIWAQEHLYFWG